MKNINVTVNKAISVESLETVTRTMLLVGLRPIDGGSLDHLFSCTKIDDSHLREAQMAVDSLSTILEITEGVSDGISFYKMGRAER